MPKRLPLSPPVVYRYVNGSHATFAGVEASATVTLRRHAEVLESGNGPRATDETFDEPLFGIAPFAQRYVLDLHTEDRAMWVDVGVTATASQHRVSLARLEISTANWTTLDVHAEHALPHGFGLCVGLENLTNEAYAEHVNAPNPFTGERVLERGRYAYLGVTYLF